MRFAWLRENSDNHAPVKPSRASQLIFVTYNVIWWVPILLALTKIIDYRTGFIAFLTITIVRAIANVYRNNVLAVEQAESFPLRAP